MAWPPLRRGALIPAYVRHTFGGEPDGGVPQRQRLGNVSVPVKFLCGARDPHCDSTAWALSHEHCFGGYILDSGFYPLGHDMLPKGRVHDAVVSMVKFPHLYRHLRNG